MTKIKICGIMKEEHARAVAENKADFIGFVFAQSPRKISPSLAKTLGFIAKQNYKAIQTVGVFVNASVETMEKIADRCQLDWIQLSGEEPWIICRRLSRPVIKVIHMNRNMRTEDSLKHLEYLSKQIGDKEHIFLLDSVVTDRYGGTGLTFDWKLAQPVTERFPIILAGGLSSRNVVEALNLAKPMGIDVSTGVENAPGDKDITKIKEFIETVRNYDNQLPG